MNENELNKMYEFYTFEIMETLHFDYPERITNEMNDILTRLIIEYKRQKHIINKLEDEKKKLQMELKENIPKIKKIKEFLGG